MRERLARLETVERSADEGHYGVVDYVGRLQSVDGVSGERTLVPFEGGEGRDQLIELGGQPIPGFEEACSAPARGSRADPSFPADYDNQELAAGKRRLR